jgi:hypothetical protein
MKKVINVLLITIILLSITAVAGVHAQGSPFSVSGEVTDRYGNPVAGAQVTLIDSNYNVLGVKTTGTDGSYDFLNVVADTGTCKVQVQYTDSAGKVHTTPSYYINWVNTEGIQNIPASQTILPDYPAPVYGYAWGAIADSNSGGDFISGIVYLVSIDSGATYYQFANNTDGKSSFSFYAPPGQYWLYAQHWENGVVYESTHNSITITANWGPNDPTVVPYQIVLPLNSPASSPNPAVEPSDHVNIVNGTIITQDGKPFAGATVTLLERSDNASTYVPIMSGSQPMTAVTDSNGYYQFYGVSPTDDAGNVIDGSKAIKIMVQYTDLNNTPGTITASDSDTKLLYNPDVILGYGQENAVRNVTMPSVTLPFSQDGWVTLSSAPSGANIYIDGQELYGANNQPLVTPCTAYIASGTHTIKMTMNGYTASTGTITMVANIQHPDYTLALQMPIVPAWVTLVASIVILIVVTIVLIILITVLFGSRIRRFLGGMGKKRGDRKASKDIARAHKAEAVEQRKTEQQRRADEKMATRRDSFRDKSDYREKPNARTAGMREPVDTRDDVNVVNVDPVKRRHEPKVFEEGKKVFEGSKKIIDFRHIAESVPKKKIRARDPTDDEPEKSSVVFASDMYKKPAKDVERIPYDSAPQTPPQRPSAYSEREALVERPQPMMPQRSERVKIPRMSQQRDTSSAGDKDRVLRYIRDHPEGVSFIQMSNDLEIIPNNLTYITKELVINDDIEKVKGLYYYKSHTSSTEDSSSSVVVWRLDGDK